jgi:sec-independent protein translocase protein TatB
MSSAELLIIAIVALVAFGPSKLPMLASHLATCMKLVTSWQQKFAEFWQSQLNEHQLQDNLKKAQKADEQYKDTPPS